MLWLRDELIYFVSKVSDEAQQYELKAEGPGKGFKSVGDRDVADAAYMDVFTAVLKPFTGPLAATRIQTALQSYGAQNKFYATASSGKGETHNE